jgi:serine/threonine protein kinase
MGEDIVEHLVKINGQKTTKVYQKLSLLGKGGFAECYLTRQRDTGRRAATKVIPKKLLDSHRTKLRVTTSTIQLANEIKLNKSLHN